MTRMSVKKYRVKLTTGERQELKVLVSRGRAAAYKQTHARVLLLSDEGQGDGAMKDEEIARALRIGCPTVGRVRRRCLEEGVDAALERRAQIRRRRKKLDGQGGSPPDCPDLRRTAPSAPLRAGSRMGELDAEIVGGPAGRMRGSGPHQP